MRACLGGYGTRREGGARRVQPPRSRPSERSPSPNSFLPTPPQSSRGVVEVACVWLTFLSLLVSLSPPPGSKNLTNKKDRTVHRPYGGVLSGANVKSRIVRAFLIEEQKIVKKVLKLQEKKSKK